ncbi:MAG: homocysteine S-methyltransferase family protein [Anaerolineae bacterium]|nr:homocysteine S-methyltransferase family protein [Anaerolineae bacterium]
MEDIVSRLEKGRIIVADGATGTMLLAAGLPAGTPPERWVLENPTPLLDLQRAYVEAGSDLIIACTFGANRARLGHSGLADQLVEVNQRAVQIAREAAGSQAYVAADIGPTGELMAPIGKMTYEQALEIFAEQAAALAEAGVDVLYVETMSDLNEMKAAIAGAQQAAPGIPIFATFSFDHHGRTNMGVKPEQAAEALQALGVAAFGANCGATLEMTEEAVAKMHEAAPQAALIAKPNAGYPRMEGREVVYDATPEDMAEYAKKFIALGARVVGGCCGSTPEHVRAIAEAAKR